MCFTYILHHFRAFQARCRSLAFSEGLFNLFNLLNSDAGTQSTKDQMAAQEAKALQARCFEFLFLESEEHHEKKEVTDVKPEKHSLLGKLMKVR